MERQALRRILGQALGYNVPRFLRTPLYDQFLDQLACEILYSGTESKKYGEMRWEEIWDTALRIRNLFLRMPFLPT